MATPQSALPGRPNPPRSAGRPLLANLAGRQEPEQTTFSGPPRTANSPAISLLVSAARRCRAARRPPPLAPGPAASGRSRLGAADPPLPGGAGPAECARRGRIFFAHDQCLQTGVDLVLKILVLDGEGEGARFRTLCQSWPVPVLASGSGGRALGAGPGWHRHTSSLAQGRKEWSARPLKYQIFRLSVMYFCCQRKLSAGRRHRWGGRRYGGRTKACKKSHLRAV